MKRRIENNSALSHDDAELPAHYQPPFDRRSISRLREMESFTERNFVDEIIRLFLSSVPALLDEAKDALNKNDFKALARIAHRAQSSCYSVGAENLGELFKALEKVVAGTSKKEAWELVESLDREFTRVGHFLMLELRDRDQDARVSLSYKPANATLSQCFALASLTIAVAVLFGWYFGVSLLTSMNPRWIAMVPNSAMSCVCAALAIFCFEISFRNQDQKWTRWAWALTSTVFFISTPTLLQFLLHTNLQIDTAIFRHLPPVVGTLPIGRMAANTAINYVMVSLILAYLGWKRRPSPLAEQLVGFAVCITTLPVLLGYSYGASFIKGLAYFTEMSMPAALAHSALGLSLICWHPNEGIVREITCERVGGGQARRLLPSVILIPFFTGWLAILGIRLHFYETEYAVALIIIVTLISQVVLVVLNSRILNQSDLLRRGAESRLEKNNRDLKHRIEERTRELKQANEELQKAQKGALAALEAKSNFLANMSHEIRTPLNAVIGLAEILDRSDLSDKQREQVRLLRHGGETLLKLVSDVLDFSKNEAGKLTLENIDFSPSEILESIIGLFTAKAKTKGLTLTRFLDPSLARILQGDPTRIGQALGNLVHNAIKFTTTGEILIAINPSRNLASVEGTMMVEFSVKDTGIGLSRSDSEHLFRPFVQADSSITRQYGGTGLGLSICKQLVERMGGKIGVESQPGKGARFWFCLPLTLGTSKDAARLSQANGPLSQSPPPSPFLSQLSVLAQLRVLLVEDHSVNQRIAELFLEQLGCRPTRIVENGAQALEAFKQAPYDLILMDVQMPLMDGLDATKQIRALELSTGHHVPIIAMTASVMAGDAERCIQAGMDAYISKPLRLDELSRALERILGKEKNTA